MEVHNKRSTTPRRRATSGRGVGRGAGRVVGFRGVTLLPATGPEAFLRGDHDVLRVLLERRAQGSRVGARADRHRVALVVGGGGMRGAYPAGMLRGLEQAGLAAGVDEVFGASSGAFTAASFVVGHAAAAASSFPEDLARREFIDLRRFATRRPVLSLDYLVEQVLGVTKPMPWDALLSSATPMRVIATEVTDLRPHTLDGLATVADWKRALRASAAIPLFAGPPVAIGGRRFVDGSIGEPLALARAIRAGATHVLVLLSRPGSELRSGVDGTLSWWARGLDRLVPGLGTLAQGTRRYGADLQIVTDLSHPDRGSARLCAIEPSRSTGMGALCIDPVPVGEAVRIGHESVAVALDAVAR